jgi:hypothetical protein
LAHGRQASGENRDGRDSRAVHSPKVSREAPMIAEHLHSHVLEQHVGQTPDRRLRNRAIIGNVIAWIAIIVVIRLIFF